MTKSPAFDAYVLSESSLFVYPTKMVLKTCGTTRLLNAVPCLLDLAAGLGMTPRRCKYSRASYLYPELQVRTFNSLHVRFRDHDSSSEAILEASHCTQHVDV